jgi:hypothetical protein
MTDPPCAGHPRRTKTCGHLTFHPKVTHQRFRLTPQSTDQIVLGYGLMPLYLKPIIWYVMSMEEKLIEAYKLSYDKKG